MAAGYMLALALDPQTLRKSAATVGARAIDRPAKRKASAEALPSAIERAVVGRALELSADGMPTADREWKELCRLSSLLARFEQMYRAGPAVWGLGLELAWHYTGDLEQLASHNATDATFVDIDRVSRAAIEDLADLANLDMVFDPALAQGPALGGADADLIAGQILLDLKSSGQPGVVGRKEIWQLLGYLLADTDDRYRISDVGFAALRWRSRIVWSTDAFLVALGGGERDVASWRQEFADVCALVAARRIEVRARRRRVRPERP